MSAGEPCRNGVLSARGAGGGERDSRTAEESEGMEERAWVGEEGVERISLSPMFFRDFVSPIKP